MFQDLDDVLKKILDDPQAPAELRAAQVRMETPDRNFNPTGATVNLFLYDVKENRVLRDPAPIVEKVGNQYTRKLPPLRVDCSYIVTAWSNRTGETRMREEHRLLAFALTWLNNFPVIKLDYLQGTGLQSQPYPPPTTIAQLQDGKSLSEFWMALGILPRAAFGLTVTLAMESSLADSGSLVTNMSTNVGDGGDAPKETWFQVGGRVLGPDGRGIADAWVEVVDMGLRATADSDGRYVFARLPGGTHPLQAVAVGFQPQTRTCTVPGQSPDEYDITLNPL